MPFDSAFWEKRFASVSLEVESRFITQRPFVRASSFGNLFSAPCWLFSVASIEGDSDTIWVV
jgi:hypothetical protein